MRIATYSLLLSLILVGCKNDNESNILSPIQKFRQLENEIITTHHVNYIKYNRNTVGIEYFNRQNETKHLVFRGINVFEESLGDFNKDSIPDIIASYQVKINSKITAHHIGMFQYTNDSLTILSFIEEWRKKPIHNFLKYSSDTLFVGQNDYYYTFEFRPKPTIIPLVFDSIHGIRPATHYYDETINNTKKLINLNSETYPSHIDQSLKIRYSEAYEHEDLLISLSKSINHNKEIYTLIMHNNSELNGLDFILEQMEFLESNTTCGDIYKTIEEDILKKYEDGFKVIGDYTAKNYINNNSFYSIMYHEASPSQIETRILYVEENFNEGNNASR